MPQSAPHACSHVGCAALVRNAARCPEHARVKEHERGNPSARGYDYAWQKRRDVHLSFNPLCVYCLRDNRVTVATICDHVLPHRGDPVLFAGPIQSLCKRCHDSVKAKEEADL